VEAGRRFLGGIVRQNVQHDAGTLGEVSDPRPPLLALHGQPGSSRDFDGLARALAGACRVVRPDRPGWASRAGEPAGGFAAGAADAVAVVDREGVERAVVLGFSWGGGVAVELAARYPERVSGLVLAASIGPGEPTVVDRLMARPLVGRAVCAGGLALTRVVLGRRAIDRFVGRRMKGLEPDQFRRLAVDHLTRSALDSFMAEQRALVNEWPGIVRRLGDLQVPTVVVTGDRDRLVAAGSARRLAAAIPGAELRVVPGAGHFLPGAGVAVLAEAVLELAARAAGQPRTASDASR
jgi:pimeloyl-ACP methyl ester carboxylesterase